MTLGQIGMRSCLNIDVMLPFLRGATRPLPVSWFKALFAALVVSQKGSLQTEEYTALVLTQWVKYMKSR